jgi:hypothetical protein
MFCRRPILTGKPCNIIIFYGWSRFYKGQKKNKDILTKGSSVAKSLKDKKQKSYLLKVLV